MSEPDIHFSNFRYPLSQDTGIELGSKEKKYKDLKIQMKSKKKT